MQTVWDLVGLYLGAVLLSYFSNPYDIDRTQMEDSIQDAFDILTVETGVSPPLVASDFGGMSNPDNLALLSYLSQLQAKLGTILAKPEPMLTVPQGSDGRASPRLSPRMNRKRRPSATGLLNQVSQLQGLTQRVSYPLEICEICTDDRLFPSPRGKKSRMV